MAKVAYYLISTLLLVSLAGVVNAEKRQRMDSSAASILGQRNPDLYDGAQYMIRGDFEEGIRRTRLGLDLATNDRERQAGLSNLCAGYLHLGQLEVALEYCNDALAINPRNWRALCNRALVNIMLERYSAAKADIELGEELAPYARNIKDVRAIFRDATQPVVPTIEIDDRRDAGNDS